MSSSRASTSTLNWQPSWWCKMKTLRTTTSWTSMTNSSCLYHLWRRSFFPSKMKTKWESREYSKTSSNYTVRLAAIVLLISLNPKTTKTKDWRIWQAKPDRSLPIHSIMPRRESYSCSIRGNFLNNTKTQWVSKLNSSIRHENILAIIQNYKWTC